jgi:CheY-like chemotaxis protein
MTPAPRPTVLVLDDDAHVRRTMRRFLETYGYGAAEASTYDEMLTLLQSTPAIFAVILDIRLGGERTGLDVLEPIRSRPEFARIPVLVMTGGVVDDAEQARIAKHKAHLFYKPEGFDTLLDFLDQLTGRDRLL